MLLATKHVKRIKFSLLFFFKRLFTDLFTIVCSHVSSTQHLQTCDTTYPMNQTQRKRHGSQIYQTTSSNFFPSFLPVTPMVLKLREPTNWMSLARKRLFVCALLSRDCKKRCFSECVKPVPLLGRTQARSEGRGPYRCARQRDGVE